MSERTYPVLSRACIGVGIGFLLLSAFGNWRFGWSLSQDLIDRTWLAVVYAGSDVAAGVMVAAGATMLWREGFWSKVGGIIALVPALILVSLSILSTFGMMSGRIGVMAGHQAALRVDQDRLSWLRAQTVNRENPKGDRRLMRLEERQAAQEARKAASEVSDPQAVAIANASAMVGVKLTVEQTQVALTLITSTMPMAIKFTLIWLGFLLYGAKSNSSTSRETKTQDGSGGSGSGERKKLSIVSPEPKPRTLQAASTDAPKGKLTYSQFQDYLKEQMAHGDLASSTRAVAAATGWSQTSVVKGAKKVKERHHVRPEKRLSGGGGYYAPASG